MAALVKVTGRRLETTALVVPDPPPQPQPSLPPNPVPPPALPPPRDPWNYLGGIWLGDTFLNRSQYMEARRTLSVGRYVYTATFVAGKQVGAWYCRELLTKLYPDSHPLARTLIPEWDYFNW